MISAESKHIRLAADKNTGSCCATHCGATGHLTLPPRLVPVVQIVVRCLNVYQSQKPVLNIPKINSSTDY